MKDYMTIQFGEYQGTPVNEIPMEYLTWLFPKLYFRPSQRELYKSILEYFLTRDVRVESGQFYFNDHTLLTVDGSKEPFMTAMVLKNSNGKNVYMVGNSNEPVFIEEESGRFKVFTGKYAAIDYKYSGNKMIVEFNNEYYFQDNQGLLMIGAFLMKLPILPKGLNVKFSENLLIKNLTK